MSITSDLRAYAEQGRTQLTHVLDQAQTQLTDVTGDVNQRVSDVSAKATAAIGDLRTQAEKTLNIDAIKSAVEPYLAQVNEYRATVSDRVNGLVDSVTSDKRVAKVVETAEQLGGTVAGVVTERVVKPVQNLTGLGGKPSSPSRTSNSTKAPATKPATTRPAPKPAAAAKSTAKKATSATKSTARKAAPAKKTTSS